MSIKSFLIGSPIETIREKHERLSKKVGLAVFSSDPLSSVAYGTEEIMFALVVGGVALLNYTLPIAIAIVITVAIVVISYYQTIHAYSSGGGAYIVAKENLGVLPGLIAGSALLIDYVLTVTVSVAAGMAAITSAFPATRGYTVTMCIASILFISIINLRGVRESGKVFSSPVYIFIGSLLLLIAASLTKSISLPRIEYRDVTATAANIFPMFIILKAFASGCVTLTGIEAISNGVRAFKAPEAKKCRDNPCVDGVYVRVSNNWHSLFRQLLWDTSKLKRDRGIPARKDRIFEGGYLLHNPVCHNAGAHPCSEHFVCGFSEALFNYGK